MSFNQLHRRTPPAFFTLCRCHLPRPHYFLSFQSLTTAPPQDAALAKLVLGSDPQALTQALQDPSIRWTPDLVDKTLKRLSNHGPKALLFFKTVGHLCALSSSSFDLAIDIAARMRDYNAVWALVARMRSSRLGPGPKTFAIVAERLVAAGKPDRAVKVR